MMARHEAPGCARGLSGSSVYRADIGQRLGHCVPLDVRKLNRKFTGALPKARTRSSAHPAVAFYGRRKQASIPGSGFGRPCSQPYSFFVGVGHEKADNRLCREEHSTHFRSYFRFSTDFRFPALSWYRAVRNLVVRGCSLLGIRPTRLVMAVA
jgi:hypothetical protein